MTVDKKALGKWLREIREILNREWDPISGCPEDEYESYARKIAAMVRDGTTDEQLLKYLERAEVENMGLSHPFDVDRGNRVVAALRAVSLPLQSA
jgi:hypothetical protein